MNRKSSLVIGLKSVLLSSALLVMLVSLGCSEGNGASTGTKLVDTTSPADKVAAAKKESLPAPSTLSESSDPPMVITAKELVQGISKNSPKKNIKEYFAKFADITGVVTRMDEVRGTLEVVLDGETDGELGFVMCKAAGYDEEKAAAISIGDTITVTGQIKAMKENPGQAGQDNMMIQSLAQVIKPCDFK